MGKLETRIYNGYKQFRDPATGEWIFVHRRVMEKKLGGPIRPGYEVHHKNHDKLDNRPENLVLLRVDEHREVHNIDREMQDLEEDLYRSRSRRKSRAIQNELDELADERDWIENKHKYRRRRG